VRVIIAAYAGSAGRQRAEQAPRMGEHVWGWHMLVGTGAVDHFIQPRRQVSIRRDEEEFVTVLQPEDLVVFSQRECKRAAESLSFSQMGSCERRCSLALIAIDGRENSAEQPLGSHRLRGRRILSAHGQANRQTEDQRRDVARCGKWEGGGGCDPQQN
jgi:hypothetical protein